MSERVASIADAVRTGRASARETCRDALSRIADGQQLNAIVSVDAERSLREADAVDARIASGACLPLAGVPIAVKDLVWVEGRRITQGSRLFADFVAPCDATAIARLKAAGAVVVGIANSSEFGCKGVTANPLHGATLHPHDRALTPGGSSGGCASAVAAGLVPAAIGTDAGGSSRRPAAHVGIVGFKPGAGAVPNGPGFPKLDLGLESLCPMTRDVADARLVFSVMAGSGTSEHEPFPAAAALAWSPCFGMDLPIDPEIGTLLDEAIETLRADGLSIERRDPVWPPGADPAALMPLQHAMLADLYGEAFKQDPALFDPDIAVQIDAGLRLEARAVSRALRLSAAVRLALDEALTGLDAILSPTVPCFAWALERLGPSHIAGQAVSPRAHAALTPFANHGGHPAISLPVGNGSAGLPAGLHLCGRRHADDRLLDLASRVEAALGRDEPKRRLAH